MKLTKNNQQVTPAFLALGFSPSQRSGGYYDTTVLPVFLTESQLDLLTAEWFNVEIEFPEAKAWFDEWKEFYFPGGFDGSRHWTETHWALFSSLESAERKAEMWADNDISEEMPPMEFMHTWQAKELARHIVQMQRAGKCS